MAVTGSVKPVSILIGKMHSPRLIQTWNTGRNPNCPLLSDPGEQPGLRNCQTDDVRLYYDINYNYSIKFLLTVYVKANLAIAFCD